MRCSPPVRTFPRQRRRSGGFTIIEAVAAMVVTVIISGSVIATLLNSQSYAARTRLMTNARVIVQRNIDTALGVRFTAVETPPILAETGADGSVFTEGGDEGESTPVAITGEGDTVVEGTLTRIVQRIPANELPNDTPTAVMKRITFRIEYEYLGRPYMYEMSTIRAQDDQTI